MEISPESQEVRQTEFFLNHINYLPHEAIIWSTWQLECFVLNAPPLSATQYMALRS